MNKVSIEFTAILHLFGILIGLILSVLLVFNTPEGDWFTSWLWITSFWSFVLINVRSFTDVFNVWYNEIEEEIKETLKGK